MLAVTAGVVAFPLDASSPAQAAGCAPVTTELDNGSFEAPVIANASYKQITETSVPGWSTTASDRLIEIWSSGFNGVQAAAGRQFAELNATQTSALYQDLPTVPGQTLTWSLAHRARQGTDTMRVVIGTPGNMVENAVLSDTTAAWGRHTGTYTVPAGQTITRFAFEAVSTGSGNKTIGNFLDDISFGTPACIEATKEVRAPSGGANVGDTLTYVVTLTNAGGAATRALTLTDAIPAGTSYVTGSASPAATLSGSTLTFTPPGVSGEAGVLEPGGSVTVSFQVDITNAAANSTISNSANVSYNDGITNQTGVTNTVTTPVAAAADVDLVKGYAGGTGAIAAGGTITMYFTATNLGPNTATDTVISDTLPAGVSISGSPPSGCSAVGQLLTCTPGTLTPGQARTYTVDVIAPNTAGILFNTARVVTSSKDPNPANDRSTAGLSVVPPSPANVAIEKTASPTTVRAGDTASYQLTVYNGGQAATASTLTLTDPVPAGFTVTNTAVSGNGASSVSCSGSTTVTCTIAAGFDGTIGSGTPANTATVTVTGRIDSSTPNGTLLTNTASLSSGPTATATITVDSAADVFVTKTLATDAEPGVPVSYQVTVINAGPSSALATVLTDTLPDGTTLLTTPSGCSVSGRVLTCALGDLAPGTVQVVNYEVAVPNAGGTFTNRAVATSTTPIIDPAGATDSVTFTVAAFGRLATSGASLAPLWVAGGLFGLGLVLVLLMRRRNR